MHAALLRTTHAASLCNMNTVCAIACSDKRGAKMIAAVIAHSRVVKIFYWKLPCSVWCLINFAFYRSITPAGLYFIGSSAPNAMNSQQYNLFFRLLTWHEEMSHVSLNMQKSIWEIYWHLDKYRISACLLILFLLQFTIFFCPWSHLTTYSHSQSQPVPTPSIFLTPSGTLEFKSSQSLFLSGQWLSGTSSNGERAHRLQPLPCIIHSAVWPEPHSVSLFIAIPQQQEALGCRQKPEQ